jgi:hypothetical protein
VVLYSGLLFVFLFGTGSVVQAVFRTWTVLLVTYVVKRAFQVKLSALKNVLGNFVTTTVTVLEVGNVVAILGVLAH